MARTFEFAPAGGIRLGGKTYRAGERLPETYSRQAELRAQDQSQAVPGSPPNFGRPLLPHISTFQSLYSSPANSYRNYDEATRDSRENALRMRRDCFIMECIEARQRACAMLNWHIEPEDPKSHDQREAAELLTRILKKTPRFSEYRRNLCEAIWYGRYGIQKRIGKIKVNGQDRYGITDWDPINGDKLVFRYDDGSGKYSKDDVGIKVTQAFLQHDYLQGDRTLEATEWGMAYFLKPWERKLITVHRHMIEDSPFEDYLNAGSIHGVGIRARIYWTWIQMQEALGQLVEFIERTGQGIWIYYYPHGDDAAKQAVENTAVEQSRSNVILMPRMSGDPAMDAFGIDRIDPNPSGAENLKSIVHEFFGHRIKRYVLGQTLSSESQATGLGSGVADLHYASFLQIIRYDATNLEETITKDDLRVLRDLNLPGAGDYEFYFKIDTETPESEFKLRAFEAAYNMGARIKEKDILDTVGVGTPSDEDVILQNPMIRQQERLWKESIAQDQMMQAQAMGVSLPTGVPGRPPGPAGEDLADLFGPLANGVPGQSEEQPAQYSRNGRALQYAASGEPRVKEPAAPAASAGPSPSTPQASPAKPSAPKPPMGRTAIDTPAAEPLPTPKTPANTPQGLPADSMRDPGKQPPEPPPTHAGQPGLPAGLASDTPPTPGETRTVDGKNYRFNEHSRWESAGEQEGAAPDKPGEANAPAGQEAVKNQSSPTPAGPPLADRQKFARTALKGVHPTAAGVMRAMQASPKFNDKGEYSTHDFAPQQVQSLHQEFTAHVGKELDGGRVVDLGQMYGQGAIGYSSPAGAMVLVPPKTEGAKWIVHYTAMTGPVARAMQGQPALQQQGQASPAQANQQQPTPQAQAPQDQNPTLLDRITNPIANAANAAADALSDESLGSIPGKIAGAAKGIFGGNQPPAGQPDQLPAGTVEAMNAATTPAVEQPPIVDPVPNDTPQNQQNPQENGLTNVDPVSNAPTERSNAPAEQQPQPAGLPDPPPDPRPFREHANGLRSQHAALMTEWKDLTNRGVLTRHDHATYRQQLSALKSQVLDAETIASRHEKAHAGHQKLVQQHIQKTQAELQKQQQQTARGQQQLDRSQQQSAQQERKSQVAEILRSGRLPDGRELHDLTRDEFVAAGLPAVKQKQYVLDAIDRGVTIRPEVMKDLPEMQNRMRDRQLTHERKQQIAERTRLLLEKLKLTTDTTFTAEMLGHKQNRDKFSETEKQLLLTQGGLSQQEVYRMNVTDARAKVNDLQKASAAKSAELRVKMEAEAKQKREEEENFSREQRQKITAELPPALQQAFDPANEAKLFTPQNEAQQQQKERILERLAMHAQAMEYDDPAELQSFIQEFHAKNSGRKEDYVSELSKHIAATQNRRMTNAIRLQQEFNTKGIHAAAAEHGVPVEGLQMMIEEHLKPMQERIAERERQKKQLREELGPGFANKLRMADNRAGGYSMASKDAKARAAAGNANAQDAVSRNTFGSAGDVIANLDQIDEIINRYDILSGETSKGTDTEAILKIIQEGPQRVPQAYDPEVIRDLADTFKRIYGQPSTREPGDENDEPGSGFWDDAPDSSVPFQRTSYDGDPPIGTSRQTAARILYKRRQHPERFNI